ncbi:MAG: hypothetical protein GY756_14750 [bacterium]|nr:hypothetical protein [bacterium]
MQKISLKNLIFRFKWRISLTFALVILESLLGVLFPLFTGLAIDDLLKDKYNGIIYLAVLGVLSLLVGSVRRFYDTRIYANIYCQISPEMVEREQEKGSSVSKISARSSLLTEFVEFLENSMPEVIDAIVSLIGIIAIISTLNMNVFYACIGVLLLIFGIYALSGKLNYKFNENYNNQLEKQVEILEKRNIGIIRNYYKSLMKWNIKLSDLETVNYLLIWIGVIALFIYAPITVIKSGVLKYGLVFSVLMYVFEYIEKVVTFPLYIQKLIRLQEISRRMVE